LDAIKIQRPQHNVDLGDIGVVYTPLHGAGEALVTKILEDSGVRRLYVVSKQAKPDPEFPTLVQPNPEEAQAFALGLELAQEKDADLILATDPDADRLGVMFKTPHGFVQPNGNVMAVLMADYMLTHAKKQDAVIIGSLVSTRMVEAMAKARGASYVAVPTGFKYVALEMEKLGDRFLFGFEESYGTLFGTHVRDKDAVVAALLWCEMAAFYKKNNRNFAQILQELYETYGFYQEQTLAFTLSGADGLAKTQSMMRSLRQKPFTEVGGKSVEKFTDYLLEKEAVDACFFELEGDSFICVRPSGTEPKMKVYIGVKAQTAAEAGALLTNLSAALNNWVNIF
jgi:phosphoglucomutase